MSEWSRVVTSPLGIAGFALFLVFGYLAKRKRLDERRWITPIAMLLAVAALAGGFVLAYVQTPNPTLTSPRNSSLPVTAPSNSQLNKQVQQTSTGQGSPNVQGVQGDVTVTIDQSTGKTETRNTSNEKPINKHATQR